MELTGATIELMLPNGANSNPQNVDVYEEHVESTPARPWENKPWFLPSVSVDKAFIVMCPCTSVCVFAEVCEPEKIAGVSNW